MRIASGRDLRCAIVEALRDLQSVTGGSAGVIGVDPRGVCGLQLSKTMSIASIVRGDAIAAADSMGEQLCDPHADSSA